MSERFRRSFDVGIADNSDFFRHCSDFESTYTEENRHVTKNEPGRFRNTYDVIQANAVGTDIYEIIARAINGDTSVSFETNWEEADYTTFTLPLIEMQSKVNEAKRLFNSLSSDIKERYNNDFNNFAQNFASDFEKSNTNVTNKDKESDTHVETDV